MKNFVRSNQYLSLCGLNCHLCLIYLGNHCQGCGRGNQSCKIARCSILEGNLEYCFECEKYPCTTYDKIDDFDSFITHRNQKDNLRKAQSEGIEKYNAEQKEKEKILDLLLKQYNDGRKKTFYCIAVNLLDMQILQSIMRSLENNQDLKMMDYSKRCDFVYRMFNEKEKELKYEFKLKKMKRII
ncbi:MAG: DUF3795 domain-containing protein [Anaerorhabdus sp.]|uniref:DUF3795 domain-containing protein n=1 Tax=Anaerorhabdus sp. TaxID=1872524 RepID=UPI002FCAA5BA